MDLESKVAIVTGGSRGIGRAIVADLAAGGARVFFTYNKNEKAAEEVAAAHNAKPFKCPQSDGERIEKTVDAVMAETGRIDILVNNAGVSSDQFLMMMPFDQWEKVVDTNLNGVYRWVKAACRPMISARSGSIVNIASVSGMVGVGGQTNYSASKGAIIAFTRSLAAELGIKGIRVNAVVPGFIETDMTAVMPRPIKQKNIERILLKRFGKTQEVARVVSFIASDEASYIVGQAVVVDGGLTSTVI